MFYYYAYLIDCQVNGGVPKKIATGCAKVTKTGGRQCTFNEFLKYIDVVAKPPKTDKNPPKPLDYSVTTELNPPLDATAKELEARKIMGTYMASKIHVDIGDPNDVAGLFKAISSFLSGQMSKLPNDELRTPVRLAIDRVAKLRFQASSKVFEEDLQNKFPGIDIKHKEGPLGEGSSEKISTIDMRETLKANSGLLSADDLKAALHIWHDDKHDKNIIHAEAASDLLSLTCSR
jgi:hypothetical protein